MGLIQFKQTLVSCTARLEQAAVASAGRGTAGVLAFRVGSKYSPAETLERFQEEASICSQP